MWCWKMEIQISGGRGGQRGVRGVDAAAVARGIAVGCYIVVWRGWVFGLGLGVGWVKDGVGKGYVSGLADVDADAYAE